MKKHILLGLILCLSLGFIGCDADDNYNNDKAGVTDTDTDTIEIDTDC